MRILTKYDGGNAGISSEIGLLNTGANAWIRAFKYTGFSLVAFAAKSVLCRMAPARTNRENSVRVKSTA